MVPDDRPQRLASLPRRNRVRAGVRGDEVTTPEPAESAPSGLTEAERGALGAFVGESKYSAGSREHLFETVERILADRARPAQEPVSDLAERLRVQREWSRETFGPGDRLAGILDHIRKELIEVEQNPTDVTEWIDVVILALDGAWRAGHEPEAIVAALDAKYAKNQARTWPDWRTADPNAAIEHVPDETDPTVCAHCGKEIVFARFLDHWYEPDADPGNDPLIWRHKSSGYGACKFGVNPSFAAPLLAPTSGGEGRG